MFMEYFSTFPVYFSNFPTNVSTLLQEYCEGTSTIIVKALCEVSSHKMQEQNSEMHRI